MPKLAAMITTPTTRASWRALRILTASERRPRSRPRSKKSSFTTVMTELRLGLIPETADVSSPATTRPERPVGRAWLRK